MAKAYKTLLRSAVYQAPQGELRATPARVRRWAEQYREMQRAGIKVPCSWGHQADALPFDPRAMPRAQQQYHFSKYNAGYLSDMQASGPHAGQATELSAVLDCPGVELEGDNLVHWVKLPDGRQVKAAIGEVSVAIRDWKDGTGKLWPDAIVHVALTPLPVAHNMGGFRAPPGCDGPDAGITLSLSGALFTLSTEDEGDMAEEKDDKKDKKADDAPKGGESGESKKDYFSEGMEFLKRKGISLPDDTTAENFWERVCIAGHALENADASTADLEPELDLEPEPEPEMNADEGAEYAGEDDMASEEQRPVMMSLATVKDPLARKLLKGREDEHKAKLLAKLNSLVGRGAVKPRSADKIRSQITGYTLSLDAEGDEIQTKEVDRLLSLLDEASPGRHPLKGLKSSGEARRPDQAGDRDPDRQKRQEEAGDELASLAGAR